VIELKPETVEIVRHAFKAVHAAVIAIANDPGREQRIEGGSLFGDVTRAGDQRYTTAQVSIRPECVADLLDGFRAELEARHT
jgi:predicted transcriptional regulator YheO